MSVEIIYKCDKCETVLPNCDQLWSLGVGFANYQKTPYAHKDSSIQVCRVCLIGYGLIDPGYHDKPPVKTPPSTEDLIIEILDRCGIHPEE